MHQEGSPKNPKETNLSKDTEDFLFLKIKVVKQGRYKLIYTNDSQTPNIFFANLMVKPNTGKGSNLALQDACLALFMPP